MRIAIFTDIYLEVAGGIPSSITAQKLALEKLGHSVTIFCPGFKDSYEKSVDENGAGEDPSIVILPSAKNLHINGAPLADLTILVERFIKKTYPNFADSFDVIHSHYEAGASIVAVNLAKKFNLPLIQTMHGREDMAVAMNIPHPFKNIAGAGLNEIHKMHLKKYSEDKVSIKRDTYLAQTIATRKMWELMVRQANCADRVITPSQHFADKLKLYGVSKPISVVSNGVSDEIVNKYDWKIRSFKNASNEPLKIIWTSRLSREKRILEFLDTLTIVKESTTNFHFTVIGDGNDMKIAKRFVKAFELDNNVTFLGSLPHEKVLECLKDQHLSVINSFGFDTQGLTILEAGASGLPVIYCDPDMDQVVLKDAGMRAKDESPEMMAKLILDIIKNPDSIEEMSRNCFKYRDTILQSTQIKHLLEVYESAIKDHK